MGIDEPSAVTLAHGDATLVEMSVAELFACMHEVCRAAPPTRPHRFRDYRTEQNGE
jgi:hypothetical protein